CRYLHQKVARLLPSTLKNMWLLNDLRRFQSDERIKIILLHVFTIATIAGRSPPTVYAFLNPKFPSATWDFFCPRFNLGLSFIAGDALLK
ncbi:hypothetical protein, partial [Pseudomonas fluorescens]|uniref:hypothetical protein n=1 Tax=Pseudomonas fluorescens TaxID=294 RepID=UPI001E2951C0